MQRIMMKSKIHNACVTQTELLYEGSITIDSAVMDEADIIEHERVQVVNLNNGARFETYTIRGEAGSGMVCLNGPAARMASIGDIIHIISYAWLNSEEIKNFKPTVVLLDVKNNISGKKDH